MTIADGERYLGGELDAALGSTLVQTVTAVGATLVAVGAVLTPDPSSFVLLAPVVAVPLMWRMGMAYGRRA